MSSEKTWQQTKSEQTRQRILQATIDCIYEIGYNATTTERIAQQAGVSRGAMLHHFANRGDLISSAVRYLSEQRIDLFLEEESRIQEGNAHSLVDEGIDAYWRQLHHKLAVVVRELQVLARTDRELHAVVAPALADYDRVSEGIVERVFPDLAESENHHIAELFTRFLLDGLALNADTRLAADSEAIVLQTLKTFLKTSYADVLQQSDRDSAKARAKARRQQRRVQSAG